MVLSKTAWVTLSESLSLSLCASVCSTTKQMSSLNVDALLHVRIADRVMCLPELASGLQETHLSPSYITVPRSRKQAKTHCFPVS